VSLPSTVSFLDLTLRGLGVIEDDEKKVIKTKQVTTRKKCMGGSSGPCALFEGFHDSAGGCCRCSRARNLAVSLNRIAIGIDQELRALGAAVAESRATQCSAWEVLLIGRVRCAKLNFGGYAVGKALTLIRILLSIFSVLMVR